MRLISAVDGIGSDQSFNDVPANRSPGCPANISFRRGSAQRPREKAPLTYRLPWTDHCPFNTYALVGVATFLLARFAAFLGALFLPFLAEATFVTGAADSAALAMSRLSTVTPRRFKAFANQAG